MFGHQDDKKDDEKSSHEENVITPDQSTEAATDTSADKAVPGEEAATPDTTAAAATDTPADDAGDAADLPEAAPVAGDDAATAPATDDKPADDAADDGAWQHPGTPLDDDSDDTKEEEEKPKGPAPIEDIVGASAGPDFKPFPSPSSDYHGSGHTDNTPHELIDVKQKALDDLAPLLDQLDQSPEDKFRTIMMMIQASDDQNLIESAYEAAHQIKDDRVRAQALLDIVNEINYFTQHPEN